MINEFFNMKTITNFVLLSLYPLKPIILKYGDHYGQTTIYGLRKE